MKKTLLSLAFTSLFLAGAAQAGDHSAVVDISGNLTGDHSECSVKTELSSVDLSGDISDLPLQDVHVDQSTKLKYTLESNDPAVTCYGKVALQFHGIADTTTGTVLANTDTGETAAKGVGIGIYDNMQEPLRINNSQITPMTTQDYISLALVKLSGQTPVEGTIHGALTIDIVRL